MVTNHDRKSFGSHWKNSKSCSDDWYRWCFWSTFRHFRIHFTESFRMSKYSWMMDPTRSREMPSCPAIGLAKIQRSSKISSLIWSIISGVVTALGCSGRGASQVEKSPHLNWATQFLTVAYESAFPLMFPAEWHEFPSAPALQKKKTWRKLTSRCCWNCAPHLICFLSASVTRK